MAKLSDIRFADWLDQVASALESGMDPSNAVSLARPLGSETRTHALSEAFRGGTSWGDALEQHVVELSDAETALLEAAALGGRLPVAMRRVSDMRREAAKLKRRAKLAIAYPVFLIHFAAIVFSISYLVQGDMESFLVSSGMIVVPVWLLGVASWTIATYWPQLIVSFSRRLPVFGGYRKCKESGILAEVLASCFAAGMDVADSWTVAARAADSPRLYRVKDSVLRTVQNGRKVSESLEKHKRLLPQGFLQVYRSGEETGSLEQNLEAAAKRYLVDANNKLLLASIVYPKIVLVGVFGYVGYKIISMVANYYDELLKITA